MSSPFLAVQDPPQAVRASIAEVLEECLVRTAEALHDTGAATHTQISHALVSARRSHAEGVPMELLEALARVLGHVEEQLGPVIADLGDAVASTLPLPPPLVPFGGKLIAPTAFYDSFEPIRKLGRALLAPVLYAEDADAIGVGSPNPIAATILGEEIVRAADRRLGIKPFVTLVRLDYESWTFLNRKHFGL